MRRCLLSAFAFVAPGLLAVSLSAQNVFVLPAQAGSVTPTVFNADPFNQAAVLSGAGFSTTFAFAGPSGKFYLVSNTSNGTIQVTDSTFANLHTVANVVGVLNAAITPDAKRILEVSSGGILNILDTSTDTLTVNGSFYGGPILDLAPSLDSTRGYAIISNLSGTSVAIFDARTGASINTIPLGQIANATAISVAPTGLIYVSVQGAVLELDPNNYSVRRTINVTGRPGKLSFTPDGKTGLAANVTGVGGTAVYELDMPTRTLRNSIPQTSFPSGIAIDRIVPVGNNRALAYSSSAQTLYDIALDTLNVSPYAFTSGGGVTALAVSNNLPAGNNLNTSFLFYTTGSTVYRADLNANQITGQLNIGGSAGAMSFAAPGVTNGTPATLLTFGDNQSIAPNVTSAPLVLKVIDAAGRPLAGVQVNFSSAGTGVTFSNANVVTDSLGDAVTTVAAATSQVVTVNVTAGGLTTTFTENVGGVGPGGGGGGGGSANGGLFIVSGQGEIITEQQRTNSSDGTSMVVQLNDATGVPIQGANVVFTFQSGSGTVVDNQGGNIGVTSTLTETTTTCTAGQKNCAPGQASVDFLANVVPTFPPAFLQASVTATAPDGTTVTFFITTVPFNVLFQAQIEVHQPVFGSTITAQAGATVKGGVQAIVSSGTASPIPNVGLFIQNVDPTQPSPASCAGGFPLSDGTGLITCDLVVTAAPGNYQFLVVVGGTRTIGPFRLTVTPGVPTTAKIVSGDAQSGNPGTRLVQPLVIQVTDAAGNTSANVPVTWSVSPTGAATLTNASSVTDSNGMASAIVTFSANASGPVKVTAQAGNLTALTFNLTAVVPTAGIQLVSGGGQSVGTGSQFANPVVVKVVNANGAGVPGVAVSFSASNGASVGSASVNTDANGLASVTVTAVNAGTIVVTAQSGGFSVTATLTAIPPGPSNLVFLNGASFQQRAISPGEIVAIQGTGLVQSSVVGIFSAQTVLGPLPTTFQGITVTFNGIAAPIFSVSNTSGTQQVVVQVPYEIGNASSVTVVITIAGGGSTTVTNLAVQPYAPGIFETTIFGQKQAVAVHSDGNYVTPSNPARRGENIIIYLTGLGQTNPATGTNRTGAPGQNVVAPMVAGINLAGTTVVSTQLVPGLIGVYALTLTIPPDAPTGLVNVGAIEYDAAGNPYFAQGSSLPIQ